MRQTLTFYDYAAQSSLLFKLSSLFEFQSRKCQGWRQEFSDTGAEFPDAGAPPPATSPPPDFFEIWCS